jgi:hypothetical protein
MSRSCAIPEMEDSTRNTWRTSQISTANPTTPALRGCPANGDRPVTHETRYFLFKSDNGSPRPITISPLIFSTVINLRDEQD